MTPRTPPLDPPAVSTLAPHAHGERFRARPWTATERAAVIAVAAGGAVGAAFAGTSPTGWPAPDDVVTAAFAAVVTLAAARARRWTLLVAAGIAAGSARTVSGAILGFGALAVAVWCAGHERTTPWPRALVGALAVQALLRIEGFERDGASTVLVALAVLPVLASGWRKSSRRARRAILAASAAALVVGAMASAGALLAAVEARREALRGIDAARDALSAGEAGETEDAAEGFERAAVDLARANDRLDAWWTLPARAVPIVGHQLAAAHALTDHGAEIAQAGAAAARGADPDELRVEGGAIDLERVEAMRPLLVRAAATLTAGDEAVDEVRSPWLLGPVEEQVDRFDERISDVVPDATRAAHLIEITPALLGADGPRNYLVMFMSPAEMRGTGGTWVSYAHLRAEHGRVEMVDYDSTLELNRIVQREHPQPVVPAGYYERWGEHGPWHSKLQDITFSADFPSVATIVESLGPTLFGVELDGVLMVDPVGLAGLLELSGPVEVPGAPVLTAENAADYLLREQYLRFGDEDDARREVLARAARLAFEQLLRVRLPGPRVAGDALSEAVHAGRLAMHAARADEQAVFVELGMDNAFPANPGDFVSLLTQNFGANKIDVFLHRELDYAVEVDPGSGDLTAVATVRLRNDAPSSGLPDYVIGNAEARRAPDAGIPRGRNRVNLSLYTPHRLDQLTVDGVPFEPVHETEFGLQVYWVNVTLEAQSDAELRFHLSGHIDPGSTYRLGLASQPTVNPDVVTIRVDPAGTWRVAGTERGQWRARTDLRTDEEYEVVFEDA